MTVMYGCEAWTLRNEDENRLEAAEMWFYMRLLNISCEDRRTNQSVLDEVTVKRDFLNHIKRRRLEYVGHAVRNPRKDLMSTVLQGKANGKRNRWRPAMTYIDNIKKGSCLSLSQIVRQCDDCDNWQTVANFKHEDAKDTNN